MHLHGHLPASPLPRRAPQSTPSLVSWTGANTFGAYPLTHRGPSGCSGSGSPPSPSPFKAMTSNDACQSSREQKKSDLYERMRRIKEKDETHTHTHKFENEVVLELAQAPTQYPSPLPGPIPSPSLDEQVPGVQDLNSCPHSSSAPTSNSKSPSVSISITPYDQLTISHHTCPYSYIEVPGGWGWACRPGLLDDVARFAARLRSCRL